MWAGEVESNACGLVEWRVMSGVTGVVSRGVEWAGYESGCV